MKRQALSLISLLSLLLVAGSAIAQDSYVRANVPFSFTIGDKTLPAGTYSITRIGRGVETLLLQSQSGASKMMVGSNSVQNHNPSTKSKLVFNRYRDHYFLSEIWEEGATCGRQIPKTSREKELAKELAASVNHERIEIVAGLY